MATTLEKLGSVLASEHKSALMRVLYVHGPRRRTQLRIGTKMPDKMLDWHLRGLVSKGLLQAGMHGNEAVYELTSEGRRVAARVAALNA